VAYFINPKLINIISTDQKLMYPIYFVCRGLVGPS
jgi:hypothetical protein